MSKIYLHNCHEITGIVIIDDSRDARDSSVVIAKLPTVLVIQGTTGYFVTFRFERHPTGFTACVKTKIQNTVPKIDKHQIKIMRESQNALT